jgi:hypothetical protein
MVLFVFQVLAGPTKGGRLLNAELTYSGLDLKIDWNRHRQRSVRVHKCLALHTGTGSAA